MTRKTPRPKVLPATLDLRVIPDDLKEAVCGSPSRCTIANAIRRIVEPSPTFISVKPNGITITWHETLHYYKLTNQALRLIAQNDDGTLSFAVSESRVLRLPRTGMRAAHLNLTPERRQSIKEANERRRLAGKTSPKTREQAARAAGKQNKKLAAMHASAA
jgi:hypothetical protein